MPRYFFHTEDNGKTTIDTEGLELLSDDKAHGEAVTTAGEIMKEIDGKFRTGRWTMRVRDHNDKAVSDISVVVERRNSA